MNWCTTMWSWTCTRMTTTTRESNNTDGERGHIYNSASNSQCIPLPQYQALTIITMPTPAHHPDFVFDDGSVHVEDAAFKVHWTHLSTHSEIFADLSPSDWGPKRRWMSNCTFAWSSIWFCRSPDDPLCACWLPSLHIRIPDVVLIDILNSSPQMPAWPPRLISSRASYTLAPDILSGSKENVSLFLVISLSLMWRLLMCTSLQMWKETIGSK